MSILNKSRSNGCELVKSEGSAWIYDLWEKLVEERC